MSDSALSQPQPVTAGKVRLRGKVDRIDVGEDFFTIIDYKTGAAIASMREIREGWSLQLPVYLYAVEALLRASTGASLDPAAGLYYRLRDPVELKVGIGDGRYRETAFDSGRTERVVSDGNALREVIESAVAIVNGFVDQMAGGKFPLTSPENIPRICSYCEFKTICRIQAVRHVRPGEQDEQ